MATSSPSNMSPAFSVIAERFRRAGQIDRAVTLCREGLEAFPELLSARVTLGCALMELGQDVEAHRELQAVLKRAPDNLAAIRGLAELHARGVDGQEAQDAQDWQNAQLAELERMPAVIEVAEIPALEEPVESPAPSAPMLVAASVPVLETVPAVVDMVADIEPLLQMEPAERVCVDAADARDVREMLDTLDDFDPAVEPVSMEPVRFEIEDVIDAADEPTDTLDDFDPVVLIPEMQPAEPVAVPSLSAGPIAVLDEWLARIRARRSELLSEYAAG